MVLRHREHISRPGFPEKRHPLSRVKVFRRKQGDKIFVSKVFLLPVSFPVMLKGLCAFSVHISGIPLIGIGRNTVKPPVDKNPQFFPEKPSRRFVLHKGIPLRFVAAAVYHLIHFLKNFFFRIHIASFSIFSSNKCKITCLLTESAPPPLPPGKPLSPLHTPSRREGLCPPALR